MKNKSQNAVCAGSPEAEKYFAERNRRREARQLFWKRFWKGVVNTLDFIFGKALPFCWLVAVCVSIVGIVMYGLWGGWNEFNFEKKTKADLEAVRVSRDADMDFIRDQFIALRQQRDSDRSEAASIYGSQMFIMRHYAGQVSNVLDRVDRLEHDEASDIGNLRGRVDLLQGQHPAVQPLKTMGNLTNLCVLTVTNYPATNGFYLAPTVLTNSLRWIHVH